MKFKVAFILILVVSSVFAQSELRSHRPLLSSTPQLEEVNNEAYSKIPDEYRSSVENTINRKASMAADAETVNKFNIEIDPKVWTNNCGRGVIYYNGGCWHKYDKDGRLIQFGNEKEFEELIWCNKRKNELIVEFWKDNKIVDNALSNAVKHASANVLRSRRSLISSSSLSNTRRRIKEGDNLGRSRMSQSKVTTILEELIPIKEAMKLAKEGKGKGFYQLAVRYARGEELPKDQSAAYKMLRKACDVEYGNAVLIDGLCDESWLVCDLPRGMAGALFAGRDMEAAMNRYCGTEFYRERREYDFITNKVAFAEVMGKYEKAKQLGVLAATNQIEALNKRLAEFTKIEEEKAVKIKKAEENRKALLGLLGEDKPHDADVEERKRVEEANAFRQERERAERAEQRQSLLALQEEMRKIREKANAIRQERERAERVEQRQRLRDLQEEIRKIREAREGGKESAKKQVDAKIDAFMKEYLGVQFGDSIEKFEKMEKNCNENMRNIPVLKKYKYFDKANGVFVGGKLYSIRLYCNIDNKYSENSVNEQIEKCWVDMAVQFGLESDVIKGYKASERGNGFTSYCLSPYAYNRRESRQRGIRIEDYRIEEEVAEQEKAKGETLPEAK